MVWCASGFFIFSACRLGPTIFSLFLLATFALWVAWRMSATLSRWAKKRVVGLALLTLVTVFFNFSRAKVQCQHSHGSPVGRDYVVVFLRSFRDARHLFRRVRRSCRRCCHAWKILVDFSCSWALAIASTPRQAPCRLFFGRRRLTSRSHSVPWRWRRTIVWLKRQSLCPHSNMRLPRHPATLRSAIGSCFAYVVGAPSLILLCPTAHRGLRSPTPSRAAMF